MYSINTRDLKGYNRIGNRTLEFKNEPAETQIIDIIDLLVESCLCQYLQLEPHNCQRYNVEDDKENIAVGIGGTDNE